MSLRRKKPLRSDPEKTREWQRRSRRNNSLKRSHLDRKTRLNPVNAERRREARERDFGDKADWIRTLPCDTCGAPPPSDPSHYPTRAAGGTKRDLLPMCRKCHRDLHAIGVETFCARQGRSVEWLAARTEHWEREWLDMGATDDP